MSFAAVHIPEFPIAAWLRSQPALKARPLVVLRGLPPQESVASVNAIANMAGVSLGMSKVQAETACAAHFRARDLKEEIKAFDVVLEVAGHFSPRVQAVQAPSSNYAEQDALAVLLLIDRSGTGSLFGTAQSYAGRLHEELTRAGFANTVVTAHNAEAALMLARSRQGVLCVKGGELRQSLTVLPTSLLPCDAKTQAVLQRWGIKTLGQLAQLPEDGLISRLGQRAQRLQQLARGEAQHLLAPEEETFSLSASLELDSPLDDLERLLFALSRLLGDILHKAVEHAYAVRILTTILALDKGQTHSVRVAPANPTQNRDALLKLISLELQAHPPQSEVFAVRLDADPAKPQSAQRGLFQAQFPEPDKLNLLLARLRSIAGEDNVGSPQLANSHRDDAFTMVPFRPELDNGAVKANSTMRPSLRMLRPPQSVRVALSEDRPQSFFWHGARLKIIELAGPWHASGSWWDRSSFDCDYWDVVTERPAYILRLQHEHVSRNWNVVGLYD